MTITITINCDNAAFENNTETEVARILADYSRKLYSGLDNLTIASGTRLRDYNGNVVGLVTIKR